MSVSPGINELTQDQIIWGPSGDVDSPFLDRDPDVKRFIPAQKTPDTDLDESNETSFTSSSPSSVGVPNNIFLAQDFPSPFSDETSTARSTASEDIFPSPSSEPIIWIDNKNNKRKPSETEVFSNKSAVKFTSVSDVYHNLYKGLDTCLAHPLDDKIIKEFDDIKQKVDNMMSTRNCDQCGSIVCEDRIKITQTLVIAKTCGFIEVRRYADNMADMFNNRFYRVDFHQFHELLHNLRISEPPSKCLKKVLTDLFPAPMHLRAEGPLPSNHFLLNNPDTFVFDEPSMDAYFPLKDKYFMAGKKTTE